MASNSVQNEAQIGEPSDGEKNEANSGPSSPAAVDADLQASSSVQRQTSTQQKQCWVCFATEEDDPDPEWVRPCRCRGSTMWVHQKCLQRWIDEKQKGNTFAAVACGSCGFVYTIIYPPANFAVFLLEKLERSIAKACPLFTGGLIVVSLYWTAVTYGAITVMQIMGSENGMQALEKADPVLLLFGLPTIPVALITIKMVRWEDKVVQWLRDHYMVGKNRTKRRLPVPNNGAAVANNGAPNDPVAIARQQVLRDAASATRTLCGALALPTIAVVVGKLIFGDAVKSPFRRACYGAAVFLAVRGATKIYFKYQQILRQKNRTIIDYRPEVEPDAGGAIDGTANQAVDVQP